MRFEEEKRVEPRFLRSSDVISIFSFLSVFFSFCSFSHSFFLLHSIRSPFTDILPHDGKRITPHQLAAATSRTYNLSPTLAIQLVSPLHPLWQGKGYFDLQDICAHGIIEHDASLLSK